MRFFIPSFVCLETDFSIELNRCAFGTSLLLRKDSSLKSTVRPVGQMLRLFICRCFRERYDAWFVLSGFSNCRNEAKFLIFCISTFWNFRTSSDYFDAI